MHPSPNWRDRFIDLAEELCRARGEPRPPAETFTGRSLRLQLSIDGVDFDAVHLDSDDECAERFLLRCRFSAATDTLHEEALRLALQMNVDLCRTLAGVFGLDEEHQQLIFCTQQSLRHAKCEDVLHGMGKIAELAQRWRNAHPVAVG